MGRGIGRARGARVPGASSLFGRLSTVCEEKPILSSACRQKQSTKRKKGAIPVTTYPDGKKPEAEEASPAAVPPRPGDGPARPPLRAPTFLQDRNGIRSPARPPGGPFSPARPPVRRAAARKTGCGAQRGRRRARRSGDRLPRFPAQPGGGHATRGCGPKAGGVSPSRRGGHAMRDSGPDAAARHGAGKAKKRRATAPRQPGHLSFPGQPRPLPASPGSPRQQRTGGKKARRTAEAACPGGPALHTGNGRERFGKGRGWRKRPGNAPLIESGIVVARYR